MNLGQLIGELRLRLEDASTPAPALARPMRRHPLGHRQRAILDYFAQHPGQSVASIDLVAALQDDPQSIVHSLLDLTRHGLLRRTGTRRRYRYHLPEEKTP